MSEKSPDQMESDCMHSAVAPNMNHCIKCGATWTGERWEVSRAEIDKAIKEQK